MSDADNLKKLWHETEIQWLAHEISRNNVIIKYLKRQLSARESQQEKWRDRMSEIQSSTPKAIKNCSR